MTKLDFTTQVPALGIKKLFELIALKEPETTEIDAEKNLFVIAKPTEDLTGDMVFKPSHYGTVDLIYHDDMSIRATCISARDSSKIGEEYALPYTVIGSYSRALYDRDFYDVGETVVPLRITNQHYSDFNYDKDCIGRVNLRGEGGARFLIEDPEDQSAAVVVKEHFVYSPIKVNMVYSPKTTVMFTPVETKGTYPKGGFYQGFRYGEGNIFPTNGDETQFLPEEVEVLESKVGKEGSKLFSFDSEKNQEAV